MHEVLQEACEYLEYEPDTGDFYWIKQPNWRGPWVVGQKVGGVNALGYWQIGLFGKRLYGHKLAWLLTHGYWPDHIDHINGKQWDNRLCNLREVTQSQNIANADYGENRGIELHGAKYRVRLVVNGVRREVGSYRTLEEAKTTRDEAHLEFFGEHSIFNR